MRRSLSGVRARVDRLELQFRAADAGRLSQLSGAGRPEGHCLLWFRGAGRSWRLSMCGVRASESVEICIRWLRQHEAGRPVVKRLRPNTHECSAWVQIGGPATVNTDRPHHPHCPLRGGRVNHDRMERAATKARLADPARSASGSPVLEKNPPRKRTRAFYRQSRRRVRLVVHAGPSNSTTLPTWMSGRCRPAA